MISDIHNYLKLYITENGIPLKQVLTEVDLTQLAVTIAQISTPKTKLEFEDIGHTIFNALGEKRNKAIDYPIAQIPFNHYKSYEETIADVALLGYMCFQYFSVIHELPIEKILLVVNEYMNNHKVEQTDTHKINCSNPISNLIPINDTQYVRFNGKTIIPPTEAIKDSFVKQINSLLIK